MQISMTISIISSLFLIAILYFNVDNYMKNKAFEAAENNTSQAVSQIEHEFNIVENLLFSAINNQHILSNLAMIEDPSIVDVSKLEAANELKEALFLLSNESYIIDSLLLITNNNQYSSSNTVIDFSFNQLKFNLHGRSISLLNQEEYLEQVISEEFTQEEIKAINDPRLNGRLFFASNIVDKGVHMGQLWILIDNEALTSNLLNGQQYNLYYQDKVINTGTSTAGSTNIKDLNKLDSIFNEERLTLVNEISPYDLSVHFEMQSFENVQLTYLLVTLFFVMCALFFVTYWLAKWISRQVLTPVTELLHWIHQQKQNEGHFHYKRSKHSVPFRRRLIVYFILTIFMPLIITTFIFYSLSYSVVTEEIITLNSSEHHSKTIQINNELNKIMKVLASYSVNLNISPNIDEISISGLNNYLNSDNTLSKIDFFAIYNKSGDVIYSSNQKTPEKINIAGMKQTNSKSQIYFYKYPVDDGVMITIELSNRLTKWLPESIDIIAVKISSTYFSSLPFITNATAEYIMLNNDLFWDIGQENQHLSQADNTYKIESNLGINDLKFISNYDSSAILKDINQLFINQSYWLLIILLIIIIISMSLTNRIMRPFTQIISSTQDNRKFLADHIFSQIDEIQELQRNFEESVKLLNKLMSDRVESQNNALRIEYDRREIQLFAMQNQVNPHFLYNSLDNLLYLVENNEEDRAAMMINSLSHFFRYLTDRRHSIITVEKEVDFTQRYIDIMAVRFDNFVVEWDLEDGVYQKNVMKLTLQPIVENSIQHGAAHSDKLVAIKISIKEMNKGLSIVVADDGLGIEDEKLMYIRREILHSSYNKSGLFNVRDRLELYYGDSVLINIDSQIGKGTQIEIWIPYEIQ